MTQDKIKTRIARILAKASSTTSPEEAETFMQKARVMMEQHQISSLDVDLESDGAGFSIGTLHSNWFQPSTPAAEKYTLQATVAEYFSCRVLLWGTPRKRRLDIHGDEAALATVEVMFPFIWKQVLRLAREQAQGDKRATREWQRDIARGLQQRIAYIRLQNEKDRQAEVTGKVGTALVLVDLADQVQKYAEGFYGGAEIKKGRASRQHGPSAAGRALAEKVSLDRPVEGKTPATPRLT